MQIYITKFGQAPYPNGWEWDGEIFKPYGQAPYPNGWEWDGKIFKPYGQAPYPNGWEWDGKIFKPYGQAPYPNGWEWDGEIFKPYGQAPYPNGWEWDGKIFKPYGQAPYPNGWEVNGYIPIFAVAFVSILMETHVHKNNIESSSPSTSIKSKKNGSSAYEELGQLAVIKLFNIGEKMVKRVINLIRARIK